MSIASFLYGAIGIIIRANIIMRSFFNSNYRRLNQS